MSDKTYMVVQFPKGRNRGVYSTLVYITDAPSAAAAVREFKKTDGHSGDDARYGKPQASEMQRGVTYYF